MTLLDTVLDAAGGLDRWRASDQFTVHLSIDGALAVRAGRAGLLKDMVAEGSTQAIALRLTGFTARDRRAVLQPDGIAIEDLDGRMLDRRHSGQLAHLEFGDTATWDDLRLAHFCGVTVWHGMVTPFLLTQPGIAVEELPPLEGVTEKLRRLKVIFPPRFYAHAAEQIYSFDEAGLLRRLDFVDAAGALISDHCSAHQKFSGFVIPTLRRLTRSGAAGDGRRPALMDVEIFDASFT